MASIQNVSLTFEMEPVVKLQCFNFDCRFNLWNMTNAERWAACAFKHLVISSQGTCAHFEKLPEKEDKQ